MLEQNEGTAREFRLELFGGPTLYRGESIVRLSPQESLLVGLLGAVGPGGVERDELLDFLWATGKQGRLRLRLGQLLHMVRRKAGPSFIMIQAGRRVYVNEQAVSTDDLLFPTSLNAGDLVVATNLWSRGYLSQLVGSHTQKLDSFVEQKAVDVASRLRVALSKAVQMAEVSADFNSLATLASLQLQMDPRDEHSMQRLVRSLGAQGRSGEARAEYLSFREGQSRSSSTWAPSAETQELVASLAQVSPETPWIKRHLRHVGSLTLPMLGRENQRAVLQGLLNARENPNPRLVVIVANPGIGRSRILHETLRDIELSGAVVLFAKCGGGLQSRSLHPLSEALATPLVESVLVGMEGPSPRIITDTVLARPYGSSPSRTRDAPHALSSLSSICESLVQLFLLLCEDNHLVIALDDAHLADLDTLHLLVYLIRRGLPPQVTILLAVDGSHPQAPTVLGIGEPFTHQVDSYVLSLEPLQDDSIERLAVHMLGTDCPGELVSAIASLSGGSPKRATELCDLLSASPEFSAGAKSEAFAILIHECSLSLTRLWLHALQALAVANASIPIRCVAELLEVKEDTLLSGLAGSALGWVRSTPSELSLAHPLVGSVLCASLPLQDRKAIHISLAKTLEGLDDFGRANQIATHLVRGGAHAAAVDWIERALQCADDGFDPTPSVALAEELLRSGASPNLRIRLHALLGRHWLRLGDGERSSDHLERALSIRRTFDVSTHLLPTIEVARLEAMVLERERAVAQILPEMNRLREELTRDARWELLARVFHIALRFVDSGGFPEWEKELVQHIGDIIGPDPASLRSEHLPLALVLCSQLRKGRSTAAQTLLASALKLLRRSGDEKGVARALQIGFLGQYHCGSLNTREGIQARRDSLEVAEGLQDSTLFCRHHLNTAVWYLDTFDLEGAAEALSLSQEYVSLFCPSQLSRELAFNQAELLFLEGKAHEALKLFLDGYRGSPSRASDAGSLLFAAGAACCYARMRRPEEAKALLPPLSLVTSSWSVDLSLLLRAHGELTVGGDGQAVLLHHCENAVEQLRHTSAIWYLKALHQLCVMTHHFGAPALHDRVLGALELCDEKSLPFVAARLRPYLKSS